MIASERSVWQDFLHLFDNIFNDFWNCWFVFNRRIRINIGIWLALRILICINNVYEAEMSYFRKLTDFHRLRVFIFGIARKMLYLCSIENEE